MRGLACGGLSQRLLNASHVFLPYTTTTSGRSLAIRCMHVPYTVITRGRQPLKRSIIYAACITGHCGGLIRYARWKQAASKSCPEWTSNDVSSHECQVLASASPRLLSILPFSLPLSFFAPTKFAPPWLETYVDVRGIHGSLIRSFAEHRQQQLPLPLYPLCILTGRRMTDQLRGNVRPRILTPEYAAYLLQSLCSNRAVVVRPVDWSRLWRLTSDKSRGPPSWDEAVSSTTR